MGSELNKVEVSLTVAGTMCYVISLKLVQGFNCHHTFECVVDYEDLDSKWMESPAKVFDFLGQDANIEIKHRDGSGTNMFKGVITQASYIGRHGAQNHIRISGCSPTIKLDGSKTMDSFMDMTLSSIVSEAVGASGNGGEVTPQPKFSGKIDYIAQYEETCFEFLNRLSRIYGEWFFYDGITCYFGKQDGNTETVTFESEITTFDLSANLLPSEMKHYHYLVHDDNEIDIEAPKPGTSGYHSIAQAQSSSVYNSKATLPSPAEVLNMNELEAVTKAKKNRTTAGMLTVSGASQTSKIKIGGKILVKLPEKMETTKKEVDTFLVTSVVHEFDLKGDYRNTFTAIPGASENIPMQPVYFPRAFSQLATVKSNDDEKKLGRVKVEFQWQKDKSKTTNWIRVKTPDAGKSDKVPKNRGFVFIPEKDDIVMVDFEYGDPNRPYVSGSIFSEKVSEGGKENNKIKSITTRVDSSMTFDDDRGSIVIKDQKGSDSTITFDGKHNIIINATSSIILNSLDNGRIELNAKDIILSGNESISLHSPKITIGDAGGRLANKTIDLTGEKITLTGGDSISEEAPKIDLEGKNTVDMSTQKMKLSGSVKIDITAPRINSN